MDQEVIPFVSFEIAASIFLAPRKITNMETRVKCVSIKFLRLF
jgi:hypothetical protein